MNQAKWSRRQFLRTTAYTGVVGTSLIGVPSRVLGRNGETSPNDEITKAVIGVGGMGMNHLRYGGTRVLALCDVDSNHLARAMNRYEDEDVKGYRDFREVLARPDIDVVHIATPPHWHGLMSIMAAEAGKDIWCEKPMTRTIGEGIRVREAVQKNGAMFRINTWFRFESGYYGFNTPVKPIKKVVESGVLGWPLKATVSGITGFDWKFNWSGQTDLVPQEVPEELDYNLWLGPAPFKPYHPHRVHGTFRGYWDYDGGGLGDMGQHYLDPVQYLLEKDHTSPIEIEVDAPQQHYDAVSSWRRITMKYADGCVIVLDGDNSIKDAAFLEGPNGKLYPNLESTIPNLKNEIPSMPDSKPQQTDFTETVRTRKKFALNEDNGHRSCTLINLGKIAVRLGRNLKFDPDKQVFINDEEANRLIDQPMRSPWHL